MTFYETWTARLIKPSTVRFLGARHSALFLSPDLSSDTWLWNCWVTRQRKMLCHAPVCRCINPKKLDSCMTAHICVYSSKKKMTWQSDYFTCKSQKIKTIRGITPLIYHSANYQHEEILTKLCLDFAFLNFVNVMMLKNVNNINCVCDSFDQNKANMCSINKHSVHFVWETGNDKRGNLKKKRTYKSDRKLGFCKFEQKCTSQAKSEQADA